MQVSDVTDDHSALSPILRLLCASDSIKTLAGWEQAEASMRVWHRLAERLWHASDVLRSYPTVVAADVVSEVYAGDLNTMYLPAMAATRTPVVDPQFATWLRRLKLWLLTRAVTAAEDGYTFEPGLRELCREVRLACDQTDSPKLELLERLSDRSPPESRSAFESGITAACAHLKGSGLADHQRNVVNLLARVVRGDWRIDKLTEGRSISALTLAPWASETSTASADEAPEPTEVEDDEDQVGGSTGASARVDPDATPPEQELSKTRVLLLNQAEGHMLAWDWHSLVRTERYELVDWIDSHLEEAVALKARTGAALSAVALLTSRSARGVVRIKISKAAADDWTIDLARGRLLRRPPRRQRRWKAESLGGVPEATSWLRPLADAWSFQLDQRIVDAVRASMPAKGDNLCAAWESVCKGESLEHWFNGQMAQHPQLARLTSPCLATAQRLLNFEATGDHVLARLASSSPETVLPSACSYASFTGQTVTGSVGAPFARLGTWVAAASYAARNAAGSEIDVDEVRFRAAMAGLATEVNTAAASDDWVKHHNLLTCYVLTCLLASTGARPSNSPFETFAWFDLNGGLVYVDDKTAQRESGARICVLSTAAIAIVRDLYLPQLRNLAAATSTRLPEFAAALQQNLDGAPNPGVPLFFFLRADKEFDWIEVTESGLAEQVGSAWPLPWNFARHRLSTGLRRMGLSAEIIDALMGHAEVGSETHGPHSLRVLRDDLEAARPFVEKLTASLNLAVPVPCAVRPLPQTLVAACPSHDRRFGTNARRERRVAAHDRAKQRARDEIEAALGGLPRDAVPLEAWEQIGRSMLLRADRMPQPFASLRYAVYEEFLNKLWTDEGIKPRLGRRYTPRSAAAPLISDAALRAGESRTKAIRALDHVAAHAGPRLRPQMARALAAVEMCVVAGIADAKLLTSIAQHGRVVPVHYRGRWYIEAFEGDHWVDGAPVRRFEVPARAVDWLLAGSMEQRTAHKALPMPKALSPVAEAMGIERCESMRQLLTGLARTVDQCNLINRSGFEAAVMSGRLQISALPHRDLVRASEGRALPGTAQPSGTSPKGTDQHASSEDWGGRSTSVARTPELSRTFLRDVRGILSGPEARSEKATAIRRAANASPFIDGDLPNALARWAAHLLTRPTKSAGVLDIASVLRYFDALAPKVSAVAHAAHLVEMDDEELTDLYFDLVRVRVRGSDDGADLAEGRAEEGDPYAVPVLMEFHEFAQDAFGVDEPDWSYVADVAGRPAGRPGIITSLEYEALLDRLVGATVSRSTGQFELECAWVLLLGYRFGTRAGEAVGLHRCDWLDTAGVVTVLVQTNSTRGLKTPQSKRAIPLIGSLNTRERSIAEEVVRRFEERGGDKADAPLLTGLSAKTFGYRRLQVCNELLLHIKEVTLNSRATFHHTRHSFACRVYELITGRSLTTGDALPGGHTVDLVEPTRRLLLGHSGIDRRALWALARLLGHLSPVTLIKSYAHAQVSLILPVSDGATHAARRGAVDLSRGPRAGEYLVFDSSGVQQGPSNSPLTLATLVNYLRLRRQGRGVARASYVTGIGPELAGKLEATLTTVAPRLEVLHKGDRPLLSAVDLACKLTSAQYQSLISLAERVVDRAPLEELNDDELVMTVGRSGMVVLALPAQLRLAEGFVTELGFSKQDVELVWTRGAAAVAQEVQSLNLAVVALSEEEQRARKIQVDAALLRRPGSLSAQTFQHRAALRIASDRSRLISRYGLVMMMTCYLLLRSRSTSAGASDAPERPYALGAP